MEQDGGTRVVELGFYICANGGIGRRSGLKHRWATVWVQVPLCAPSGSGYDAR